MCVFFEEWYQLVYIQEGEHHKSKPSDKLKKIIKYLLPSMILSASDGNRYMVHPAGETLSSVGTNLQSMTERGYES